MKAVFSVALIFALMLLSVPAFAGDTFQALRQLPAAEQEGLVPLADEQLAVIEGARWRTRRSNSPVNIGLNTAVVVQINVCAVCSGVNQGNASRVSGAIRF